MKHEATEHFSKGLKAGKTRQNWGHKGERRLKSRISKRGEINELKDKVGEIRRQMRRHDDDQDDREVEERSEENCAGW